ncbi:hypothetical protein CORC01_12129 [Colletotrichum orchidophilum]|uniref:Uncharacterized protein n=1 Tax=Colletotrichum orchidophilum TaxID=1209926 RepID=A0A1G4ATQ3_9PEZI|nr:uncharacterized protein CORC01_12129 [Colletotrichum orchidophilum]OHE92550.1 hypothetical protein CORC01_12129 [Colletotrichum orchidophilum]
MLLPFPLPWSVRTSVALFTIRCAGVFVAFRRHCGALAWLPIFGFFLPGYSRWIIKPNLPS